MSKTLRLNEFFCDNLWRWKCGIKEKDSLDLIPFGSIENYKDLINKSVPTYLQETTENINKLADNRMMQGTFRYGPKDKDNIGNYDYVYFLERRLKLYKETNNTEYLVDLFNGIRLEWLEAINKGYKFEAVDDGEHAEHIK